jgi:hypothetical protein
VAELALAYNGSVTSASYSTTASYSNIAGEALTYNGSVTSASHAVYADSAGIPTLVPTASLALTASSINFTLSSASYSDSSSFAQTSVSASYALSASYAGNVPENVASASYAATSSWAIDLLPLAPINLSASIFESTVILTWTNQAFNQLYIEIERSDNSGSTWTSSVCTSSGATSTTVTDVVPITGSSYWYRAAAISHTSTGSYSETCSVYVPIAWEPSQLEGLVMWYRASDLTGSSGDLLGGWVDKSTNAYFITASGTAMPTISGSGIERYVWFDGSDDSLDGGIVPNVYEPMVEVIVFEMRSDPADYHLLGFDATANRWIEWYKSSGLIWVVESTGNCGTFTAPETNVKKYYLAQREHGGVGAGAIYDNSVYVGYPDSVESFNVGKRFFLGRYGGGGYYTPMNFYEYIQISASAFSSASRTLIDSYINSRYTNIG